MFGIGLCFTTAKIPREILLDIVEQVEGTEDERKDNLRDNLLSLLKRKRYIILLDDISDIKIWDDLEFVLPECDLKIGSKIIITTDIVM